MDKGLGMQFVEPLSEMMLEEVRSLVEPVMSGRVD